MGTFSAPPFTRLWGKRPFAVLLVPAVVVVLSHFCETFNLDTENRVVFAGPRGSYFGFSVEFFSSNSSRLDSIFHQMEEIDRFVRVFNHMKSLTAFMTVSCNPVVIFCFCFVLCRYIFFFCCTVLHSSHVTNVFSHTFPLITVAI